MYIDFSGYDRGGGGGGLRRGWGYVLILFYHSWF